MLRIDIINTAFTITTTFLPAAPSRVGLIYNWAVFRDGSEVFDIVSSSIQFYSYKLRAFSLLAGSVYVFRLTVLDPSTSLSCVQSVQATVIRSDLVAIISGAYERSAVLGSMITLDASYSYDADLPSESDQLQLLFFSPLLFLLYSSQLLTMVLLTSALTSSYLIFTAIESHFY